MNKLIELEFLLTQSRQDIINNVRKLIEDTEDLTLEKIASELEINLQDVTAELSEDSEGDQVIYHCGLMTILKWTYEAIENERFKND